MKLCLAGDTMHGRTVGDAVPADRIDAVPRVPGGLLAGIAGLMAALGLLQSLLGVRGAAEGFSTLTLGGLMSVYFTGYLIGSIWAPRLIALAGHIQVFAALGSTVSAVFLLHGVFVQPAAWLALRIVGGFCVAGLVVVAESWLNARTGNRGRGRLLSVYMVVTFLGLGTGQVLLNVADPDRIGLFVLVSVIVSISVVPVAFTGAVAPREVTASPVRLGAVLVTAPVAVVGAAVSGLSHSALISLGAFYATSAGLSLAGASSFMMAVLLGAALFALPVGRLSDHVDRRKVVAATAWVATLVATAALVARTGDVVVLVALGGVFGAATFALYPLSLAHLNDRLRSHEVVDAGAKLVLIYAAGAVGGPITATVAMTTIGSDGYWWHQAILHGALAVYATYRLTHLAPLEVKSDFAPLPSGATPAIIVAPGPSNSPPSGETAHPIEQPDLTLVTHVAGSGEPIVLVHGLGASSAVWLHLRRALTRLDHQVITYDLRGHGAARDARSHRLDDHVSDLRAVIAANGSRPAHLVGAGFGARIVLAFAAVHPDDVRSLTIMSWTGALPPRGRLDHAWRSAASLTDRILTGLGRRRFLARRLAAPFYDVREHPDRHALLRDAAINTSPQALSTAARELLVRPMHRIPADVPVLGVIGANDAMATSAMIDDLRAWVEISGIELIPHAGPFPQLDNPSEVLARLHRFVSRVQER